MSANPP
jgi:hypothetical protein